MEIASVGVCSCEGRILQKSAVDYFDNELKLVIDSLSMHNVFLKFLIKHSYDIK